VRRGLTRVRCIVGISTYGARWTYVKAMHDNGRRVLLRALRLNTATFTRRSWLGMYQANDRTVEQRTAFLKRVDRRMHSL
jgi:putative NADPH-quinone reductase